MTCKRLPERKAPEFAGPRRAGFTTVEAIVAFTLVVSIFSVVLPMVVLHQRLLTQQRHYRLALDELSNQLERLTVLAPDELPPALESLEVSELTAAYLPNAALSSQLDAADVGHRVTLQLTWQEHRRQRPPLTLAGWVMPDVLSTAEEDTP